MFGKWPIQYLFVFGIAFTLQDALTMWVKDGERAWNLCSLGAMLRKVVLSNDPVMCRLCMHHSLSLPSGDGHMSYLAQRTAGIAWLAHTHTHTLAAIDKNAFDRVHRLVYVVQLDSDIELYTTCWAHCVNIVNVDFPFIIFQHETEPVWSFSSGCQVWISGFDCSPLLPRYVKERIAEARR